MNNAAVHLQSLSKSYGRGKKRVNAVRDLDLTVMPNQVFGFLGPNGAGKSTTIRMMLDLVRPTQGTVSLFGEELRHSREVLHRVGALVEGAAFYPFLSGQRNLEVLARTGGLDSLEHIPRLLDEVGLSHAAGQKVAGYSTGMKQRLGIASALLTDPDLVILDEPTNGLDPAGIQEMRSFIRDLVDKRGKTVFLSSHLLSEVEQVCDSVAIIYRGRKVREGSVQALLGEQEQLRIEVRPLDTAAAALATHWHVTPNEHQLTVAAARDEIPQVVRRLVEAGVDIYHLSLQRQTLESYFLNVTREAEQTGD